MAVRGATVRKWATAMLSCLSSKALSNKAFGKAWPFIVARDKVKQVLGSNCYTFIKISYISIIYTLFTGLGKTSRVPLREYGGERSRGRTMHGFKRGRSPQWRPPHCRPGPLARAVAGSANPPPDGYYHRSLASRDDYAVRPTSSKNWHTWAYLVEQECSENCAQSG